ncbi:hypothetical protein FPV67DRAFT_1431193, partial [Lyophyllum atratum]
NAHDADVIFVSSDEVLFYIYRKNLEPNAAAFPPAEFETRGEIVPLTEDAATLELLFQYMYPQRHPHLRDVTFNTLSRLAEAAEKYEVFAAMNICSLRMKQLLPRYAAEIFSYANKHGYADIMSEAGPFVLDTPLDETVKGLSLHLVVPWVCYREAWSRAAFMAITSLPSSFVKATDGKISCGRCPGYTRDMPSRSEFDKLWESLGEKRSMDAMERMYMGLYFLVSISSLLLTSSRSHSLHSHTYPQLPTNKCKISLCPSLIAMKAQAKYSHEYATDVLSLQVTRHQSISLHLIHTVSAGDADVKFSSSDNVIFHIHRKNLEIAAAAFPSAEFDTRGEVVPLTEDAATLEFLFQYVYPQRHPHLEETSFETLAPLAEAAEKYEVFSAMTLCYIRMKNVLPNHSAEIFNYASRHGYNDILGLAAPHMLDIPLDEIVKTLSPHLIVPWVRGYLDSKW